MSDELNLIIAAAGALMAAIQAVVLFWTVRVLSRTANHQLRAYVCVDNAEFSQEINTSASFTGYVAIKIKNYGSTPAKSVVVKTEHEIGPQRNSTILFPFSNKAETHPPTSIAPGAVFFALVPVSERRLTASQWASLNQNNRKAYLWGRIDYVDAFGKRQYTTFQMFCNFGNVTTLGLCEAGNESS